MKIRDVFKGKNGAAAVPDNIDSVFFDLRDKNLYFFKNDMVNILNDFNYSSYFEWI